MVQRLSRTGIIHRDLGAVDTVFRDLLQTYDTSGAINMNDGLLFIVAVGVFTLMLVGLILTLKEFKEHVIEDPHKKDQAFHGEKVEHRVKTSQH